VTILVAFATSGVPESKTIAPAATPVIQRPGLLGKS
jgi:hypothetical protein